ncbi:MAG TPA: hypothetical protein VI365_05880 [Trebonia sp.]
MTRTRLTPNSTWKRAGAPAVAGPARDGRRGCWPTENCVEWESLDSEAGQLTHYLDHGFVSVPSAQAYAIELIAPEGEWTSARARLWDKLLPSFSPARLPA